MPIGRHRVRPALSHAARAKAEIKRLEAAIAEARSRGETATVLQLERQHAWAIVNSLR